MFSLLYNLHPVRDIPILVPVALALTLATYYLLKNQRRNMVKFRKHPTTFPNPLGGGLIGEYMKRPWREELAQLAQIYNKRRHRRRASKEERDQVAR
jgi:hypothetical protein